MSTAEFYESRGGPAFPVADPCEHAGMTLRDYFAGQALAGLIAYSGSWPIGASERAYAHADAMLKIRTEGIDPSGKTGA
jgi:hypothetical protein